MTKSTPLSLESRVLGGWRGKSAGGTLGLPAEGRRERLAYRFYDPVPETAPPNDDLELQLVWLDMMEKHKGPLTMETVADAWKNNMHYMWDEYGRTRWNLRRGVPAALCGVYENPFASCMGSPIRSEVWACVAAGNPDLAERFARLDSMIDHGAEGIAGEIFFTVLEALILDGSSLRNALDEALARVDSATETRRALELIFSRHDKGVECWAAREELLKSHDHVNFTHAPLNVALTLWALLYGREDFEATLLLGVNGGYDTDCTAATAGAVLGMLHGAEGLPAKWIDPLGDSLSVGPGIQGIRVPANLKELTQRCIALRDRAAELSPLLPEILPAFPPPSSLPGNVEIVYGSARVAWANGELPVEVKKAGGGSWKWTTGKGVNVPFRIICLARDGARLWVDGQLVVDCPAGLPYVPAPHRSPEGSFATVRGTGGSVEIRMELNSRDERAEASVLLADAAFHLAPWNGEELPFAAELPAVLV